MQKGRMQEYKTSCTSISKIIYISTHVEGRDSGIYTKASTLPPSPLPANLHVHLFFSFPNLCPGHIENFEVNHFHDKYK